MTIKEYFDACEKASAALKEVGLKLRFLVQTYSSDLGLVDDYICYDYKGFESNLSAINFDRKFMNDFLSTTKEGGGNNPDSPIKLWWDIDNNGLRYSIYIDAALVVDKWVVRSSLWHLKI